uniref:hypothetical protein n=1 Tax=Thaumasiovibrio occultus TaxID=1891184 RepID=UPI000B355C2F|nr:hypothetical protein [Thaumasiovibrio occultus]
MSHHHAAWQFICIAKKFTGEQLAEALQIDGRRVRRVLDFLLKHHRIKRLNSAVNKMKTTYLVIDTTPPPSAYVKRLNRPLVHQRLWNVCRINKTFTLYDLRSLGDAGEQCAKVYINSLVKSGLVRRFEQADATIYRLTYDIGPKHPIRVDGGMQCQNNGEFYPYREGR